MVKTDGFLRRQYPKVQSIEVPVFMQLILQKIVIFIDKAKFFNELLSRVFKIPQNLLNAIPILIRSLIFPNNQYLINFNNNYC